MEDIVVSEKKRNSTVIAIDDYEEVDFLSISSSHFKGSLANLISLSNGSTQVEKKTKS